MTECPRLLAVRDHQILGPDVIAHCIESHIKDPDPKKRPVKYAGCTGCPDWPFKDDKNNHSKWPEG